MENRILFSLENCIKCTQTKDLLSERNDIKIVTYPHNIDNWDENQLKQAKNHEIFNDLQITAPILIADGEKIIGYLRIRKWLQENKFE
jgi:glutaredoxin